MRFPVLILIILLIVNFFTDLYIYRRVIRNIKWLRIRPLFWCINALMAVLLVAAIISSGQSMYRGHTALLTWTMFFYFCIYIPKLIGYRLYTPTMGQKKNKHVLPNRRYTRIHHMREYAVRFISYPFNPCKPLYNDIISETSGGI